MKKFFFFLAPLALLLSSCTERNTLTISVPSSTPSSIVSSKLNNPPLSMIRKASIFKMDDKYANNVVVSLDYAGNLSYYPAPSDLNANSAPLKLANGWWLNRQGFGAGAQVTSFTYEQYRNLDHTPSHQEILNAIIPDAVITDLQSLPISHSQALSLPIDQLNTYLPK
ncbi:MAG: hypothetical protein ACI4AK_06440 [Lepagella sp.]